MEVSNKHHRKRKKKSKNHMLRSEIRLEGKLKTIIEMNITLE